MKKIVLLLVVLSLVAGQALFAQDDGLKITGHVKTGVGIRANNLDKLLDETDPDQQLANRIAYGNSNGLHNGMVVEYNSDSKSATEFRLNFDYVKENVFAHARFNAHTANGKNAFVDVGGTDYSVNNLNDYVEFAYAFGGFSFLDKKIEVSAGILDNRKWGSFNDFHLDAGLDTHNLVKIDVQPIEGLTLGINTFSVRWDLDGPQEFKDAFRSTVYGGGYEIKDTFGIHIEFVGFNSFDQWTKRFVMMSNNYYQRVMSGAGYTVPANWAFGSLLSAYFYGIDNLKLDLDAYLGSDNNDSTKLKASAFGIGVQGMYTIDKLSVGAKVDFDMASFKLTTTDEGARFWQLGITPKAEYGLNEWLVLGIDIPIAFIDNASGIGTNAKEYHDTTMAWKGGFSIGAKPKATFKLGNGCKFITFYELGVLRRGYASKDITGIPNAPDPKAPNAQLEHTIQFDFIWEF